MTLRAGHGNGRGVPRVEVLPVDELPIGVPAPDDGQTGSERRGGGKFAPGNRTSTRGGVAKAQRVALSAGLGLGGVEVSAKFAPYRAAARSFRRRHCAAIARAVGGGVCGTGPSSMVASASLQLAASRYLFDLAGASGDPATFAAASRLADASRQNLLAAHELAAREAQARPKLNAIDALRQRLGMAPAEAMTPPSPAEDAAE